MSCLRLTERCATILYSVRAEIEAAGVDVADTLRDPVEQLTKWVPAALGMSHPR
jgi:abelson tyrosine-protein kinase 1